MCDKDAALLPVTAHRRPPPARFTKFFARLGVVLSLSVLYIFSNSLQAAHVIKHEDSLHDYINRVEDVFLAVPSTESALANSRYYATHPHLAGSQADFLDAKDILSFYQNEFGISSPAVDPIFSAGSPESRNATLSITSELRSPNAWIDVYYPVLNTGNADGISLEILGQDGESIWTAHLAEDGDPGDETAAKYKDAIAPWHGLSAPGEVTGPIVYANYGTKEDYDELAATGVDITGKIVLVRYGANYRGLKIKGAEEHGAAGVLIYSDPRDDGVVVAENGYLPYPAGPARNPTSIQRGSVLFLSIYPGDPTTPGHPAYENATRVEAGNIPRIPSLPLSWANAKYLFEHELGGIVEGRKLDGKVGNHVVKMVNDVDTKVTPIWNTMAAIPGHIKDEVVVIGCHRDAWVMGAADPTSGTVSLFEVVRGLGALLKRGWKPLRTIVVASWDAEEYGLIGSTEWGEDFAQWIQTHAVSYINVDISVSGSRYAVSASPSLARLIKRCAQNIPHPTKPCKTVWDALYDSGPYTRERDADLANTGTVMNQTIPAILEDDVRNVSPLGSGSDYTVFLQRLGVASSDHGFSFTSTDPPYHYHSIYDSQMWQETYADPSFNRHVATAKVLGLLTLRLSESIILPLNTTEYALQLDSYVDTWVLRHLDLVPDQHGYVSVEEAASGIASLPDLQRVRSAIAKLQQASAKLDVEKVEAEKAFLKALRKFSRRRVNGVIPYIRDWLKRHLGSGFPLPEHEDMSVELNLPVLQVLNAMRDVTEQRPCKDRDLIKAAIRVQRVNQKLISFERGFISEEGVKDREWYRHLGVAPGKYLGYGATTLPALTEAILYEQSAKLVEHEVTRLTTLLVQLAQDIEP